MNEKISTPKIIIAIAIIILIGVASFFVVTKLIENGVIDNSNVISNK